MFSYGSLNTKWFQFSQTANNCNHASSWAIDSFTDILVFLHNYIIIIKRKSSSLKKIISHIIHIVPLPYNLLIPKLMLNMGKKIRKVVPSPPSAVTSLLPGVYFPRVRWGGKMGYIFCDCWECLLTPSRWLSVRLYVLNIGGGPTSGDYWCGI